MDRETELHLKQLHDALFDSYDLQDVVRYLEEKTFLKGDRFSFLDHEFQKDILSDTSKEVNVQKCAQIGMSEAMARYAVGVAKVMPFFSVIMTMPFSGDAGNFAKTRLNPIIDASPDLKEAIDPDLDNTEVKGIASSLLYMRGCNGSTAALSVPADMLIHDEVDRSDPDIMAQYQSRIKHSSWKLTRRFGTPTVNGKGIALAMETSLRYRHAVTCHHCQHLFVPSYHEHVIIPGYNDSPDPKNRGRMQDINKYNLHTLRWQEAHLECPMCHLEPSLQMEHRTWICENPGDNYTAVGYYVTPFSVPNVVSVPSLVQESTKYKTWEEFVNQALGETVTGSSTQMVKEDLTDTKYQAGDLNSSNMHCMGIDVGQICHVAVGRLTTDDQLLVVHRERVVQANLKRRKLELAREYRVLVTVIDTFPETHLVHEMQKVDKNLYGGIYSENRTQATYQIVEVDKNLKEGKLPITQARIVRDINFDEVMAMFKQRRVLWMPSPKIGEDDIFEAHCLDMQRAQVFDKHEQVIYKWQKSAVGQDHYWHALGYLHVACRLAPAASKRIPLNAGFGIVARIQVRDKVLAKVLA